VPDVPQQGSVNSTAEDEFKGSEAYVCELFECAFCRQFIEVRPKILKGLKLDGYCEELKMAFEYDGDQHFKFLNWFHKSTICMYVFTA